jgi:hypothetical protein
VCVDVDDGDWLDRVDWLDRRVFARDGDVIGMVVDVYDDPATGRSTWIAVGMGAFSLRTAVVPLAGALLWGSDVVIAHDRATVLDAPMVDVVVSIEPDDSARLVAHYTPAPAARSTSSHPSRRKQRMT